MKKKWRKRKTYLGKTFVSNKPSCVSLFTELRIPIYKEYITERERKYGGAQYTSHGFPPDYDPSKETITEVQIMGKKASIFTDRVYAGMNYKREYKYKLIEDRWLLDTIKEQYLPENRDPEKWKSVII